MRLVTVICLVLFYNALFANVDDTLAELQKAISNDDYITARTLFTRDTADLISQHNYLDLCYFIPYAGYIADHFQENGTKAAEDFRDFILKSSDDLHDQRQAYLEIHSYYRATGKYQLAYNMNAKALEITHQIPNIEPRFWAIIERNLGVIAGDLNQPDLAKEHALRANKGFELDPKTQESDKFNTLNSLGAIYWYKAKYDSVEYFWMKALDFTDSMEPNVVNRYYYKSMIEGNLSAVFDVTGRYDQSLKFARQAIDHMHLFIERGKEDSRWNRAFISMLSSANNLASVYQGMGNYSQALKLFEFILKEKIDYYPNDHPEIHFSEIQIGRTNYDLRNFEEAKKWLRKGIEGFTKLGNGSEKNIADAYSTLAFIAEEEGNITEAEVYYEIAEKNYLVSLGKNFNFEYLDFLTHVSEFYSLNNKAEEAIEVSQKGLDYISKSYNKNTPVGLRQNLNVGNVYFNLKDFKKSAQVANDCLKILDDLTAEANSELDSVKVNFDRSTAILLKAKSLYFLQNDKTQDYLQKTLNELQAALSAVEKRKAFYSSRDDQQALMIRSGELIDFIKKIQLELYEKTGKTEYINDLLKLQEDVVYSRIRNQLNLVENIDFYNLPKGILQHERDLKTELQSLLEDGGGLSEYVQKTKEWDSFLDELKHNYPEYYKLRYTGLSVDSIPKNSSTQIVRYLFVDSDLLAVVFTKEGEQVFKLNFNPELIKQIPKVWDEPQNLGILTSKLYRQLWEPFDSLLTEPRVMIIPDGVLFNLSFEMLTQKPISGFTELSKNCLLAKYDFSYHYSFWLSQNFGSKDIKSSYVGFVPGFSDQMKEKYVRSVTDSFAIDQAYLHLLPQPFTVELVNRISKIFHGKDFVYEKSTATSFKKNASENKIIHIGTHAESDNVSPAYSRLIFAKSGNPTDEDNSLYAYEIYGTDMSSNLTMLTACETGNPVYQPGEGMISFTHAFQYAGSESILTSLWNQDEKAGMEISDYFLSFLSKGMAKDKALKEAKLKYLSNNDGRVLSPQYWAGLILVGNPEPLEGLHASRTWFWIAGGLSILILLLLLFAKLRNRNQA